MDRFVAELIPPLVAAAARISDTLGAGGYRATRRPPAARGAEAEPDT